MVAFTAIGVGLFAKVGKILLMGKILSAEILAKQNNFDEFKTSSEQWYMTYEKKTRPYSACATTTISKLKSNLIS